MKILISGDWHLDGSKSLLQLPRLVAEKAAGCDLLLLTGDLFDGKPDRDGIQAIKKMAEQVGVPTFISPGNHDHITLESPWLTEKWPENLHIFTKNEIERVELPGVTVYGAAFDGMDCRSLLEGFRAQGGGLQIGIFHGDPLQKNSPYNPVSKAQVAASGLELLALGHIHKAGSFREGDTLCLWPGCPMGRGYDETGEKGLYLWENGTATFLALPTPRYYDWQAEVLTDAQAAVARLLPPLGDENHYRITLTGESEPVDLDALRRKFPDFPYLELRDETQLPRDVWDSRGSDSLEGLFFDLLHRAMEDDPEKALLAAKLSRRILDGGEVELP